MSDIYIFTYLGSKLRMIHEIAMLTPTNVSELYEVCGGFGAFILNYHYLFKERAVYNEINDEIYNLVHVLRHNYNNYIANEENRDCTEREFIKARQYLSSKDELKGSVDRAIAFSILQTNSYNGNRVNYIQKSRTKDWESNTIKRLKRVSDELQHIELENRDCIEIIKEQRDNVNAFILFDVPYELGERVTKGIYGEFDWDDSLHAKAYNTVRDIRGETGCKIMLMTYESKLYDRLLSFGWQKIHLKDIHSPAGLKGKPRKRKNEYVYLNYDTYSELAKYHFDLG